MLREIEQKSRSEMAGVRNNMALGIALILLCQVLHTSRCELFTALVHMEGLLELEVELESSLNAYITTEKQR